MTRDLEQRLDLNKRQRQAFEQIVKTSRNPAFAKRAAIELKRLEDVYQDLLIEAFGSEDAAS